jgi:hypothetical protein
MIKAAIVLAGGLAFATPSVSDAADSTTFGLVVSGLAKACLPEASGRVTLNSLGIGESMHVEVSGLPPKTDFDLFVIQSPNAPFGLSWYQGDIQTDSNGNGVGDFFGRFSKETFIVAPGTTAAPVVFKNGPFPDASSNPPTPPVQLYHIGIWFNSAQDALNLGCTGTLVQTPFNGIHNAGIQVLNTSNFTPLNGPLRSFNP